MRVGVDIGGTFTDVVVLDEADGSISHAKALSDPNALAKSVQTALRKSPIKLRDVNLLIHGSTVVINSIIERKGAKTALITTRGFRDVYEIGRINRPDSFNPRFQKHTPLIPRECVFEVTERALVDGSEYLALDEAEAEKIAETLERGNYKAAAILFLHSYRSPDHELQMAQILQRRVPGLFVTCSHELSREYREYERTSTVAANAYVGPTVSGYLSELSVGLRTDGLSGDLLIMQSNGGLADVAMARRQCVQMMESGPAGGVVGTMALCMDMGIESAIAFDMGGTTAKACLVQRGRPSVSPDTFIGGYARGLVIRIPVLDIVEVGAGGGSIAWLDEGQGLHVGPRSAGANPGPACYGLGGTAATITDANVALGRLASDEFLGGEMKLDRGAGEAALVNGIAGPLGVDLERAASGVLEVATSIMANTVREVTLERGIDPRSFTLFAYGGGGPLHASAVARELKISTIVVPQLAGVFSALGMLLADVRRDYVQTLFSSLALADLGELEAAFLELEDAGRDALTGSGIAAEAIVFERAADMRYVGQEHSVAVAIPTPIDVEDTRAEVKRRFDEAHQLKFNHSAPEEGAEIVSVRVTAVGLMAKPELPAVEVGQVEPPESATRGTREVWFASTGFVETAIYERRFLQAGNVLQGPAVISEAASTTLVEPGDWVTVDHLGNLIIHVED
jgi:N-methylhydantoinase A